MLEFFQPILFLTTLFYSFNTILGQNGALVYVNTTRGPLVGYHFDQGNDTSQTWYGQADVFLGIPFALKPIGELRYKVRSYYTLGGGATHMKNLSKIFSRNDPSRGKNKEGSFFCK
jgi:hypothetical protein